MTETAQAMQGGGTRAAVNRAEVVSDPGGATATIVVQRYHGVVRANSADVTDVPVDMREALLAWLLGVKP